jgi:hypothetical protein
MKSGNGLDRCRCSAVLLLAGGVWLLSLHTVQAAMTPSDVDIRIELPKPLFETGEEPISIKVRLVNKSDHFVVLHTFNEFVFTTEELLSKIVTMSTGSFASARYWGNILAPDSMKEVYIDKTFSAGNQTLSLQLEYGVPSAVFLKDHLFEVVGKEVKPSGRFPVFEYSRFQEKHPVLALFDAESEFRDHWQTFKKSWNIHVATDPMVDAIRKKIKIDRFRKNIPWFENIVLSDTTTYFFTHGKIEKIGDGVLSWDAIAAMGLAFVYGNPSTIEIIANYNDQALGRAFALRNYPREERLMIQKVTLMQSWKNGYRFKLSAKELPKLWEALRMDKSSLLYDGPNLIYIVQEQKTH